MKFWIGFRKRNFQDSLSEGSQNGAARASGPEGKSCNLLRPLVKM